MTSPTAKQDPAHRGRQRPPRFAADLFTSALLRCGKAGREPEAFDDLKQRRLEWTGADGQAGDRAWRCRTDAGPAARPIQGIWLFGRSPATGCAGTSTVLVETPLSRLSRLIFRLPGTIDHRALPCPFIIGRQQPDPASFSWGSSNPWNLMADQASCAALLKLPNQEPLTRHSQFTSATAQRPWINSARQTGAVNCPRQGRGDVHSSVCDQAAFEAHVTQISPSRQEPRLAAEQLPLRAVQHIGPCLRDSKARRSSPTALYYPLLKAVGRRGHPVMTLKGARNCADCCHRATSVWPHSSIQSDDAWRTPGRALWLRREPSLV